MSSCSQHPHPIANTVWKCKTDEPLKPSLDQASLGNLMTTEIGKNADRVIMSTDVVFDWLLIHRRKDVLRFGLRVM